MLAISVRQPWAWLIIYAGKDIENRDWATKVRGRVLIHAAKGMTQDEYVDGLHTHLGVQVMGKADAVGLLPRFEDLQRGGIIGSVEIVDCVTASASPWFFGRCGFVLKDPKPMKFIPYRGMLNFFDVPESVLKAAA